MDKNYDPSFQIQNSPVLESNTALTEKSRLRMESYRAENTIKAYNADRLVHIRDGKINYDGPIPKNDNNL